MLEFIGRIEKRAALNKLPASSLFDFINQFAVTACQLPTAFLIFTQVKCKIKPFRAKFLLTCGK
jgi:hypothetical protein